MKVVLLAGGMGTRLAEETDDEAEADGGDRRTADSLARHAPLRALRLQGILRGARLPRRRARAAYGASAKGSTLLNYFGIGADDIAFVVDRSTVKQGRYTPGTHLPIRSPEALLEDQPDYVLLLTWNFVDEILRQQETYRRRGGQFIIPIPALQVV